MDYFTTSINFTIPFFLICAGIMFGLHEQYNSFAYFIHKAFGILSITTGFLMGISEAYPKFALVFLFFGLLTPMVFISAAPIFSISAMIKRISPVNYVML